MRRIVYIGLPSDGHFIPSTVISKELLNMNIEVLYLGCSSYKSRIEAIGADYIYCEEMEKLWIENMKFSKCSLYNRKNEFSILDIEKNYARWIRAYKNRGTTLLDTVSRLSPDYIIYDAHARWGRYIANKLGISSLCIQTSAAANKEMCNKNFLFFAQYFLKAEKELQKEPDVLKAKIEMIISKLCSDNQIDDFSMVDGYGCQSDLNIIWGKKVLQPFSNYFNEEKYFFFYNKKDTGIKRTTHSRNIIYICLGSVLCNCYDSWKFYNTCLSVLIKIGDYKIVISAGENENKIIKDPSVIIKNKIDQKSILKEAILCINHGGKNTIEECLENEVPMIIYPYSNDQFVNAFMVEKNGFGLQLQDITENNLNVLVEKIMNSCSYRENIRSHNSKLDKNDVLSHCLDRFLN